MHAQYTVFAHEVDHIRARKHGGSNDADNLAYACAQCNRFKGSDTAAPDPESGELVPLFHPRTMRWAGHFALDGPRNAGWSAVMADWQRGLSAGFARLDPRLPAVGPYDRNWQLRLNVPPEQLLGRMQT